ncbi:MAG TPA: ABC transporter permease [Candidatus Angelobacter sp.]|nr:ABC transporter permease [Candidatus Angelobacter sp.]
MSISAPPEQRPSAAPQSRPRAPHRARVSARRALLVASLKMFYRNKHSIFWTLLLPVIILGVFALLNLGGGVTAQLGVVDTVHTARSQQLVAELERSALVSVHTGDSLAGEQSALSSGDRDALLVIGGRGPALTLNSARSRESAAARLVVDDAVRRTGQVAVASPVSVTTVNNGRNQGYTDFLIPGIIALSVMQTGLFTVLYTFVHLRQRGILRRLKATPLRAADFLAAQVGTRLILAAAQTLILILIALLVFRISIYGNVAWLLLVAVLGAAVFLALGFAISGSTGSVESAAPIANAIGLPMIVLSGAFFSRGGMPGWLHGITDLLPLTYLVDGLRHISYDGWGLLDIRTDLLGLGAWLVVSGLLAVRLFRWELD